MHKLIPHYSNTNNRNEKTKHKAAVYDLLVAGHLVQGFKGLKCSPFFVRNRTSVSCCPSRTENCNHTNELYSMRWFSHQRSPPPLGGMQWYRLLQRAAYSLDTAHILQCTVVWDESAVFRFFVPGDLDLWPLALTSFGTTVCLSVTLVYCGQTLGWIKINLAWR